MCRAVFTTARGLEAHTQAGAHSYPSLGTRETFLEVAAEESTMLGLKSAAPDRKDGDARKSTPGDVATHALSKLGWGCKPARRDQVRKTPEQLEFLLEAFNRVGKVVTAMDACNEMRDYRKGGKRVFSAEDGHEAGGVLSTAAITAHFSTLAKNRKAGGSQ